MGTKIRKEPWQSKSRRYHGWRIYIMGKFAGLELSEASKLLLSHENHERLKKQGLI